MFSEQQLEQFRTDGYVIVPGFFDEREVAAIQAEMDRLKRDGLIYNVATEGDGATPSQTAENLQLCPMSPHSRLFKALPFAPKVTEAIHELIGDPVVLHLDQTFYKPARSGAGTNWHQDNAYFQLEDPMKGTAMWVAVHDATVENGTLHVIPGSQHEKFEHSRDGNSNHHIRCYPPEDNVVPAVMAAGGAIFFAYGVAHCTLGNNTDTDRAGAAYHFLNESAVGPDYTFGVVGRDGRVILSGPNADGGKIVYDEDMRGTWSTEVDALVRSH